MKLSAILALLPALSRADLLAVRAAADGLLGSLTATAGPLYGVLTDALGVKMPFGRFKQTPASKNWVENETLVVSFIDATWPGLSKVEQMAVMRLLVEMLIAELKERKVPATVGAAAVNLGLIPQVLDKGFPDYRQAGMANLILKAMAKR